MTARKPQVKHPVPKTVEATVTAEILANATRKDSSHCAIADALNATYPGARAQVDLGSITLTLRDHAGGVRVTYLTPPICQQALVDFDNGETLRPFRFALRRVDAVRVRASRPRLEGTTKQRSAALPADVGEKAGRRRVVLTGDTGVAVATSSHKNQPPIGVLANRKGRVRKHGMRQLEALRAASEQRAKEHDR